jgi:SAM-dependent methyltransferase
VVGTDISERSLERARLEAGRLGADVTFTVADFRDLASADGQFDVVLSCDNAIPHLLSDADVLRAFSAIRSKLRRDGVLVVSVRDYDRGERPALGPPTLVPGPPRRVLLRLHDWDAPESPFHTVRLLVLTERADGWETTERRGRYRAVGRDTLASAARGAGFAHIEWLEPDEASWHQPVLTARTVSAGTAE